MIKKIKKDNVPETTKIARTHEKNGVESIVIMLASIFLVGMVIAVVVGVGYTFNKKIKNDKVVDNRPSMAIAIEAIDSDATSDDESQNKTTEEDVVVPEETKISPADINVNVLNNGAPAGSAGKIKDLLVKNGYAKAVAGNSSSVSIVGTSLYYSADKFKTTAEASARLLEANGSIKVVVSGASSAEQKSGDIVIILGK
ncbi:MAG: hypothetical protein COX30_03375 [Candidatus Moranbacteria bacterium CG23_combo_of_CG06-09_8_20_14_all_39_10]|nr:MAG: hypothetical protein COX30_03375 [Candidatus Moranbacteria bacterium CG23_combo_of_CG06-09_8_20_14_all_39_10]